MNRDVIYYPREAILQAVKQFNTPFFLYEEKRLRENCARFRNAFKKYFTDFQPLYAIKANPNPDILKIIIDEGFAMDASSETEAWLSSKLNVAGMYSGNYTSAETLRYAKDRFFILNLDDISMIPFLKKIGVPEVLSFRINPGIGKATMQNNVFAGPDAKYGVPFEKAALAYKLAKDIGVKKFGIHMMTGSNVPISEKDYFANIVRKLFEILKNIKDQTEIEIEFMNIGGGFGVPYKPEEESLDLDDVAQSVRKVFDEQCEKYNLREPRLMAEPGRFIVTDAGWLIAKVVVIKKSYKKFVGIDASTNDMPRPAFYDAYHYISVDGFAKVPSAALSENFDAHVPDSTLRSKFSCRLASGTFAKPSVINDSEQKEVVSIVGSICENNDQFGKDREFAICNVGDIVVIHNSGGHARAMAHNYNGKLRHAEYLLKTNGSFKQIRAAEKIEDLFKGTNL